MFVENLLDQKFLGSIVSSLFPVHKKDLIKSGMYNVVIVRVAKGKEILPHPEPYAVTFIVLEGEGIFTNKDGEFKLTQNSMIYMGTNETRGIKALESLVIVGIQDGH